MKIVLAAINSKYIHSNLAIYCLQAYAREYQEEIILKEYTINQLLEDILMDLFREKPDILCLSCYIWNRQETCQLIREIKKVLPSITIWVGGPEVSYDSVTFLREYQEVTGVMKGEGEETFLELLHYYHQKKESLKEILGITYRDKEDIVENPWREVMDLSKVPFIYEPYGKEDNLGPFANKIIYYESSRGCPFRCSYCLSSVDKCLRFRDTAMVEKELQFFLDHKVPQVKFVDRTFNCRHEHSLRIWRYILEHDNQVTNFHFEIAADLLNQEEIEVLKCMRPGLVQLEIGVQSTNPKTIREIKRTMAFEKVAKVVRMIDEGRNVHQHLDLIAGLPYEDYASFSKSFNQVYALKPEQLQLGFLKVLKGSYMETKKEDYGLVMQDVPPYEVLYTKWISYEEITALKGVEKMVEVYYNSGQFSHTIAGMEKLFQDAFSMYEYLRDAYDRQGLFKVNHSRVARFEILFEVICKRLIQTGQEEKVEHFQELLTLDFYLRENAKNRPNCLGPSKVTKEWARAFYDEEEKTHTYLPEEYGGYDSRKLRKMTHIEKFTTLGEQNGYCLFEYDNRDPLTYDANRIYILQR